MKRIIAAAIFAVLLFSCAFAETAWVLCQPDSYVNIRQNPSSRSAIIGRYECGDEVEVSGKKKNGFMRCSGLSLEETDGWISAGYLVYSKPEPVFQHVTVHSNGRVACRKTVDGSRRCWVKDGDIVKVFYRSDEWSVTDRGFIRTEYVEN